MAHCCALNTRNHGVIPCFHSQDSGMHHYVFIERFATWNCADVMNSGWGRQQCSGAWAPPQHRCNSKRKEMLHTWGYGWLTWIFEHFHNHHLFMKHVTRTQFNSTIQFTYCTQVEITGFVQGVWSAPTLYTNKDQNEKKNETIVHLWVILTDFLMAYNHSSCMTESFTDKGKTYWSWDILVYKLCHTR